MSREQSSGLSVTTLLLAAASAAAAALIVPMIWERGTVVAAAITPVIVSLVSEMLKTPVEKVKTVSVWRRTTGGEMVREPAAGIAAARPENGAERPREEPFDPLAAARAGGPPTGEDPFGLREIERPSRSRSRRRPLAIALVTGLLAFGIAAVVVTASELAIFGDSVSTSKHRTTFFGGTSTKKTPADEQKQDEESKDATPTPTPTPTETPSEEATPTPTPTPGTTPAPGGEATPAPTPAPQVPAVPTPTP